MTEAKIMTRHPSGKSGRNISKEKYDTMKDALISALDGGELTHSELFDKIKRKLENDFSGNISWYGETVKLDLEARGIIERTADKPQRYRMK